MKKILSKRFDKFWIPGSIAILAVIAAISFVIAIGMRAELTSGLSKRAGSLGMYTSPKEGISLILQSSGRDVWGFFEWPGKRSYGFFSGKRGARGAVETEIRGPAASTLRLSIPARHLGSTLALRLEGEKGLEGSFRLERRKDPSGLGIETFEGRLDASGQSLSPLPGLLKQLSVEDGNRNLQTSFFYIDALRSRDASLRGFLDRRLRRGNSPLDYAKDHWKTFGESRLPSSEMSPASHVFIERQYIIPAFASLYSVLSERYVFNGGAHGNTTAVFDILDPERGTVLESDDIFVEGWKDPVAEKIHKEALRLLTSSASASINEIDQSLVSYGFFEDRIPPASSVFLCKSGVGFHYDRYELAPYSAGDFTFILPWAELDGLLKPLPGLGVK